MFNFVHNCYGDQHPFTPSPNFLDDRWKNWVNGACVLYDAQNKQLGDFCYIKLYGVLITN